MGVLGQHESESCRYRARPRDAALLRRCLGTIPPLRWRPAPGLPHPGGACSGRIARGCPVTFDDEVLFDAPRRTGRCLPPDRLDLIAVGQVWYRLLTGPHRGAACSGRTGQDDICHNRAITGSFTWPLYQREPSPDHSGIATTSGQQPTPKIHCSYPEMRPFSCSLWLRSCFSCCRWWRSVRAACSVGSSSLGASRYQKFSGSLAGSMTPRSMTPATTRRFGRGGWSSGGRFSQVRAS